MAKLPEFQVLLPYSTLMQLLDAIQIVPVLRKEIEYRDQQIAAMRSQMTEVFEVIGKIQDELRTYHD